MTVQDVAGGVFGGLVVEGGGVLVNSAGLVTLTRSEVKWIFFYWLR